MKITSEMKKQAQILHAEAVCTSMTGDVRDINEDNYCFVQEYRRIGEQDPENILKREVTGHWIGVFDGIGGLPRGEVASYLAARKLAGSGQKAGTIRQNGEQQDIREIAQELAEELNQEIIGWRKDHKIRQMGTTMAAIKVTEESVYGISSGDSRIYRFRDGRMEQLSNDQVYRYPGHLHSVLIGYLGNEADGVKPETFRWKRRKGDRYLVCTDGVTGVVPDTELDRILQLPLEEAIDELMKEVLRWGAPDNATAIIADM